MKFQLTLFAMLLACASFAQLPFGKMVGDTLVMDNGAKFYEGQKLQLGYGSNGDKGFEFIYISPTNWVTMGSTKRDKLESGWANNTLQVKKFKLQGTRRTGKKWYIVVGGGNIVNYWCDIWPAMETGEVIVQGINDKNTLAKAEDPAPQKVSVADEIAKLKKLYDEGALTKEEFEAQKRKLLEQ